MMPPSWATTLAFVQPDCMEEWQLFQSNNFREVSNHSFKPAGLGLPEESYGCGLDYES